MVFIQKAVNVSCEYINYITLLLVHHIFQRYFIVRKHCGRLVVGIMEADKLGPYIKLAEKIIRT